MVVGVEKFHNLLLCKTQARTQGCNDNVSSPLINFSLKIKCFKLNIYVCKGMSFVCYSETKYVINLILTDRDHILLLI